MIGYLSPIEKSSTEPDACPPIPNPSVPLQEKPVLISPSHYQFLMNQVDKVVKLGNEDILIDYDWDHPEDDEPCQAKARAFQHELHVLNHCAKPTVSSTDDVCAVLDNFQRLLNWCAKIEDDESRAPLGLVQDCIAVINAATLRYQPEKIRRADDGLYDQED